jgi:antitoxin (DNA-binding transcriptional repressor) of toxin-antitoxin stability system
MKRVGIREFRNHATQYLAGDEVLAIERHGHPIGFYVPTTTSRREDLAQALEQLRQTVDQTLAETGLDEDALSRLYDLNEPAPDRAPRPPRQSAAEKHAAGR